jgi:hypothetical protein
MTESKILQVFVIMSCDRQAGDQIRGQFFVKLEEAKAEIDRLFDLYSTDEPLHISRLESNISYSGFRVVNKYGYWREYRIRHITKPIGLVMI